MNLEKAFKVVTLGPIFNFDMSGEFFDLAKTNRMRRGSQRSAMLWRFQAEWRSSRRTLLGVEGVLPARVSRSVLERLDPIEYLFLLLG